jgi:hypothetical protein
LPSFLFDFLQNDLWYRATCAVLLVKKMLILFFKIPPLFDYHSPSETNPLQSPQYSTTTAAFIHHLHCHCGCHHSIPLPLPLAPASRHHHSSAINNLVVTITLPPPPAVNCRCRCCPQ